MFFVSFQWPWHPRHYINSWNEAIYLMNMSVSNVYAPAPGELSAQLTPEQKWAPPLVVMSAKLNAWPGVNLSNFTHRGTKNGRSCQSIWKIFYLWNWILRQWGQPPVDETGSLETKLAMLPQSPCAAEHTITHWWLAIPIRAAHQDSVLICKMTKQNHQSPNLWRTPKHGCHTPRLTPSLSLQAPNCPTEPLPAIQLSGTGEGKKKGNLQRQPHRQNRTRSMENWTDSPPPSLFLSMTFERVPTRANAPSCQGSAHHAFLSVCEWTEEEEAPCQHRFERAV